MIVILLVRFFVRYSGAHSAGESASRLLIVIPLHQRCLIHMRLRTVKYVPLHSGKTEDMSLEKFTKKYAFLRVFLIAARSLFFLCYELIFAD